MKHNINLNNIEKDILEILNKVKIILKEGFYKQDKNIIFKDKNNTDYLTYYDKKTNKIISEYLEEKYPSISIISEESNTKMKNSEYKFIIDPIDGTRNFARGIPIFTSGIGFAKNNEVIFCATVDSIHDELYYAKKGNGAYCNDKKITISNKNKLSEFDIDICLSPKNKYLQHFYPNFIQICSTCRNEYCIHYATASVASGKLDAHISHKCSIWDYCHYLLVEEAGGKVTDFKGGKFDLTKNEYVCSNGILHDEIIKNIQKIIKKC